MYILLMLGAVLIGDGTDAQINKLEVAGKYTSEIKCETAREALTVGKLKNATYVCVPVRK